MLVAVQARELVVALAQVLEVGRLALAEVQVPALERVVVVDMPDPLAVVQALEQELAAVQALVVVVPLALVGAQVQKRGLVQVVEVEPMLAQCLSRWPDQQLQVQPVLGCK